MPGERSTPTSESTRGAKHRAGEAGAAAEIEHAAEPRSRPSAPHAAIDRIEQQLRPAIVEPFEQRQVVMPARTGRTARAHSRPASARASPRQAAQAARRAVAVLRIGGAARGGRPRPRASRVAEPRRASRRARTRPRRSPARLRPPAHRDRPRRRDRRAFRGPCAHSKRRSAIRSPEETKAVASGSPKRVARDLMSTVHELRPCVPKTS